MTTFVRLLFICYMLIQVVKSKIHRVRVTEAELNYIGSITIDEKLMEACNMVEGEKVQIVNVNNGRCLEYYGSEARVTKCGDERVDERWRFEKY